MLSRDSVHLGPMFAFILLSNAKTESSMPEQAIDMSILELLQRVPVLERLDLPRLRVLSGMCHVERFPQGHRIITEGEVGHKLYIIRTGQVKVTKHVDYHVYTLATLKHSDFFGEIALLKNVPRTATVTADTAVECLTIDGHDFLRFYGEFPPHIRDDMQMIILKRLEEIGML